MWSKSWQMYWTVNRVYQWNKQKFSMLGLYSVFFRRVTQTNTPKFHSDTSWPLTPAPLSYPLITHWSLDSSTMPAELLSWPLRAENRKKEINSMLRSNTLLNFTCSLKLIYITKQNLQKFPPLCLYCTYLQNWFKHGKNMLNWASSATFTSSWKHKIIQNI